MHTKVCILCQQFVRIGANLANHFTGFFPDELSGTVAHGSGFGLTSTVSTTGDCTPKPKYEDKDPFTSPGAKLGSEQKLSATASTFQPFSVRLTQGPMHSHAGNRGAQQSDTVKIAKPNKGNSQSVEAVSPTDSFTPDIGKQGIFSTDTQVTRALRISGIYIAVSKEQVETCLQVSCFNSWNCFSFTVTFRSKMASHSKRFHFSPRI